MDERPLVILPQLAVAIGLNEAIVLQQIHWLSKDTNFGKVIGEKRWIFNTPEGWQTWFPFFPPSTIRRVLENLRSMGLIIAEQIEGNMRPMFYRISDSAPVLLKQGKMPEMSEEQREASLADSDKPLAQIGHAGALKMSEPYINKENSESKSACAPNSTTSAGDPTLEEWIKYCGNLGVPEDYATDKFYAKLENGWGKTWKPHAARIQAWYRQDRFKTTQGNRAPSPTPLVPIKKDFRTPYERECDEKGIKRKPSAHEIPKP